MSFLESIRMYFKIALNPMSLHQKLNIDNHQNLDLNLPHLNNRLNSDMNNLMSIDYAIRDW